MKKISLVIVVILFSSYGPPNCLLYEGDCQEACHLAEKAIQFAQGSPKSQALFDESIEACPTFDYSYYEKAVPFAKRGQIIEWKKLIDRAVEIDPIEHLSNRGWYHFFFLNNYESAIEDIEMLDSLNPYDIGSTGDAIYHLNVLKAICYFQIGEKNKALEVIQIQMANESHYISLYDYICLGVMLMENEMYNEAAEAFSQQVDHNDLAENHYYLGMVYLHKNEQEKAKEELLIALDYYDKNMTMENGYRELPFEIYRLDIENELASIP